jgi:hypothetical protein
MSLLRSAFALSVSLLTLSAHADSVKTLTLPARDVRVSLVDHVTKEGEFAALKKYLRAVTHEPNEAKRKKLIKAGSDAFVLEADRYWTLAVEQVIPKKLTLRHVSLVLTQRPDGKEFAQLNEALELAQSSNEKVVIAPIQNEKHELPEGMKITDLIKSDARNTAERLADEIKILNAEIGRLQSQVKEREEQLNEATIKTVAVVSAQESLKSSQADATSAR